LTLLQDHYYKLLLLVGGSGAGKTGILKSICESHSGKYINLNLALSAKLKDIPLSERSYHIGDYINEIISEHPGEFIAVDNIEILFSSHLKADPMRTLLNISKYKKTIAAWPGSVKDNYLVYAEPWHKDYVKYPVNKIECLYIDL